MTAHAPHLVSETTEVAAEAVAPSPVTIAGAGTGTGTSIRRRLGRNKAVLVGGGLLLAILLVALFAPWLAPHDPYAQDLTNRTVPPVWYEAGSWLHPLGTDPLGRDYLSRLLYGARISLLIGVAVALISGLIGTTMGMLAGYFGGKTDMFVSFLVTTRLSMPVILVALATVAILGGSLWVVIIVLGLLKWDRFAVVMRSATQQVRSLDYVAAAQAAGASTPRVLLGEVLPNVLPHLIVVATLEAASAILLEAALSFLGLGVQPPLPSWGLMISEAKAYMFFSFWLIAIPGTALAVLIFSINLGGDGLRDLLAPEGRA
jgi:peptide/nickel transport system permease protein